MSCLICGPRFMLRGAVWMACAYAALGIVPMALAHAQQIENIARPDSTADSARQHPVLMAPTVITATRERQRRTESSATIDVVDRSEIVRTRASHPSGIMNRVAGVHVSELSAEGHSTAIRQPLTTKPMYLYLEDGIPTRATGFFNHNGLYEVNMPQAGGIEVLKGPGTALYGSDAIGGIINVLSNAPPARPRLAMSVEGGAYGYQRLLSTGGFHEGSHGVRADLNLTRATGWHTNAPYNRQSGTLRWDYGNASGFVAKTLVTITSVNQQDVPTISGGLFAARSPINVAPIAFRTVRAARISTAIEKETPTSLFSITPYARHDVLDLLPSWQLTYDPQVWDTRNNSVGVVAKYRRDIAPLRTRVISGVDVDYSPGHFTADQAMLTTIPPSGTTPRLYPSYSKGPAQYDYDVTYHSVSPYVHVELSPVAPIRIDAGVRYDMSGYTYETALTPVATGNHRIPPNTSVRYQHASPKLGVTYDVTPSLNLYASYRHGFRAPSQSQLFQQNSAINTVNLEPVRANSYETGIRGMVASRLLYSLAAYDMTINDDIITYVTPQNTREATNAGETRHRGIETSVGAALRADLRIDLAYAATSQRYVTWKPQAAADYSGRSIEQAPRTLGNVLVTYSPTFLSSGRAALEWVSVGRYAMDPQNTHWYAGYRIINVHANYPIAPWAEVFARVTNLTNRNYAEVVSYDVFQGEQFSSGNPRSVYAGFRYEWTR